MENRNVGFLIIGIAVLMAFIVFSFNQAMTDIVSSSCSHGDTCPMWGTIDFQTNVSIAIIIFVVMIGIFLVLSKEEKVERIVEKVVTPKTEPKKITKESYEGIMKALGVNERKVMEAIIEEDGAVFQSALVDKLGFSKVKISRILDKLEGKGIVERRRRGMTNMVILKH